ncbi:hypothetical protein C5C21_15120 [Rathayibacter tritici]|nr:hypothetical protein C5C21_15120 [Rathayibacter tritici]
MSPEPSMSPEPTATPEPTVGPEPTTAPDPTATAAPIPAPTGPGGLPSTGVETGSWLLLSGGALAVGIGSLLIARRRRREDQEA